MAKKLVYRYDDENYDDGTVIWPRGDSFEGLTPEEQLVELALREALPSGVRVRGGSIFTWKDEVLAKRLWQLNRKKYLYELEVDEIDILMEGDLNFYSDAVDAVKAGASVTLFLDSYCSGAEPARHHTTPRVEILVSKATVVRKLAAR